MFRAACHSSSGTLMVTTWVYKPEAANTVWSSWWCAVCRSKRVEPSINFGIINSITRLHLVGCFYWFILRCTNPWILNLIRYEFWNKNCKLFCRTGGQSPRIPNFFTLQIQSTHSHTLVNDAHVTVEESVRFFWTNGALVHVNERRVSLKIHNPQKSYYLWIFL
jgi:hypothetical protein